MTTGEMIVAKIRELKGARGEIKPPKPTPDSRAANFISFWALAIAASIGAIIMITVTLAERPSALIPIMFILGVAAAGLGIMYNQVLGKKAAVYEEKPLLRWFTAVGVVIAIILGIGGIVALPPIIWGR